jgi:hypothetical protein
MNHKFEEFLEQYNLILFSCYRYSGIHILTYPYPYYISSNSSPLILPFENSVSVPGNIFKVNYISDNNQIDIPWEVLNEHIINIIISQFDILSEYNKHFQIEFKYIFNENNFDLDFKINELSHITYEFIYNFYKNTNYNYEIMYLVDFISKIQSKNTNINIVYETNSNNIILYINIFIIYKLLENLSILSCKILYDKNNIICIFKYHNFDIKKCKDLKNKLLLQYIIETHNGEINEESELVSNLLIKIPVVPKIFLDTVNFKNRLKNKKILFISNNIQIDKYLIYLFNSYDIDIKILSYDNLYNKQNIFKRSSNNEVSIEKINNRKPHVIFFIIDHQNQLELLDECKQKINERWKNIQCFYLTVNICINKYINLPISSEEFINMISPPSPNLFKIFKHKKKHSSRVILKNTPQSIIIFDNKLNTNNLKEQLNELTDLPIYFVEQFPICLNLIKSFNGNLCIIFDESINKSIILELYNYIEENNYNTILSVILNSKSNLEQFIFFNIRFSLIRPYDNEDLIKFLNDMKISIYFKK